ATSATTIRAHARSAQQACPRTALGTGATRTKTTGDTQSTTPGLRSRGSGTSLEVSEAASGSRRTASASRTYSETRTCRVAELRLENGWQGMCSVFARDDCAT